MKKFIFAMRLCLSAIVSTALVSCDKVNSLIDNKECVQSNDNLWFLQMYDENIVNPEFTSSDEAVAYQISKLEQATYEDTFLSLPEDAIVSIANVCIKKYGTASPIFIAKEYLQHKDYIKYTIDTKQEYNSVATSADTVSVNLNQRENERAMEEHRTLADDPAENNNTNKHPIK